MAIQICHFETEIIQLRTRMPFRYGIATMTAVPHLFLRLEVEIDGRTETGVSADLLPPKWFTKDPNRPLDAEVKEMEGVIEHAGRAALGLKGKSAFAIWEQLYAAQSDWGQKSGLPPLLSHFGTSLVERALLEAV